MTDCPDKCPYVEMLTRELDGFSKKQDAMNKLLSDMAIDVALLKYKSGLFGAAAGLIPGIISALVVYLHSAPK